MSCENGPPSPKMHRRSGRSEPRRAAGVGKRSADPVCFATLEQRFFPFGEARETGVRSGLRRRDGDGGSRRERRDWARPSSFGALHRRDTPRATLHPPLGLLDCRMLRCTSSKSNRGYKSINNILVAVRLSSLPFLMNMLKEYRIESPLSDGYGSYLYIDGYGNMVKMRLLELMKDKSLSSDLLD